MQELNQATNILNKAKNIIIVGPKNPDFDQSNSALSLFYTLNKSNRIVNHCFKNSPQTNGPKTFVISINSDDVSQFYYEKKNKELKIFLTTKNNFINEKDVQISAQSYLPEECDLIISIGLKNLEELNSFLEKNFKLFYQTKILNIDNKEANNRFGDINLIQENQALSVTVNNLMKSANLKITKKAKLWLLLGIIDYLKNKEPDKKTLKSIADLISIEVDFQKMISFLYKEKEAQLLVQAFKRMELFQETAIVTFTKEHLNNIKDLKFVLEKLTKETFHFPKLLVLWQENNFVKGVFYSRNQALLNKFTGQRKNNGIMFQTEFENLKTAKQEIKNILCQAK